MDQVDLGIIGCGAISDVYFEAANRFDALRIAGCADIDAERAEEKASKHGVPAAYDVDGLLAEPGIDVAVVLTPPAHHGEVALQALEAGKHVYTEKPLAPSRAEGEAILEKAAVENLLVGAAPDTFLGTGLQTCRDVIDEGRIGDPLGAVAFWASHGHESWHPSPRGFYQEGGGPMFDMGPYYVTALVSLLGPATAVAGGVERPFAEREITSEPQRGDRIDVEVPTHETGIVEFESGATGTLLMSFDVWGSELPGFEIYGTEGTLSVTNPNRLDGTPRVHERGMDDDEWVEVPVTREHPGQQRGFGIVDLAYALRSDWEQRASGELAYHVLEIMDGVREAADAHDYVELSAPLERPAPIPDGFPDVY